MTKYRQVLSSIEVPINTHVSSYLDPSLFLILVEWLKNEREAQSKLMARLDIQIFTVSKADKARLATFSDVWEPHIKECIARVNFSKDWPFDHTGPHGFLEHPPRALFNEGFDLWTDDINHLWTKQIYTINLDRETFSVDNRTFYNLWDIPQHCKTGKFPLAETSGRRPQALPFNIDFENYFRYYPVGDRDKYQAIYLQYNNSMVEAIAGSSELSIQQAISMMFFEKFTDPYAMRFWDYAPSWGHKGFAFREFAFAILSIATGRYYFVDRVDCLRFAGYDHMGYIVDRNNCGNFNSYRGYMYRREGSQISGKELLLPIFGSECHESSICPGSAPLESLYWFENVLVSLMPDSIFRHGTEAAIAKAVEYGFGEGKTSFQIIIFSIFNVILLEAYLKDGVKVTRRTGVISIQDRDRTSGWTLEPNKPVFRREADVATTFQQVCHKHTGFAKLQNFFDVAARRNLPPTHTNERLPAELYVNIILYADPRTLHAMSQVSWSLRRLCQEQFAFSEDLEACGFDASLKGPTYVAPRRYDRGLPPQSFRHLLSQISQEARPKGQPELCLNDLGTFTFRDRLTRVIYTSGMDVKQKIDYNLRVYSADEDYARIWCPVIGGISRPSLISQFMFHMNFKLQRPGRQL